MRFRVAKIIGDALISEIQSVDGMSADDEEYTENEDAPTQEGNSPLEEQV